LTSIVATQKMASKQINKVLARIFTRLFLANFYLELDVEHIPQYIFGYVDQDKMVCYVEIVICKRVSCMPKIDLI
jgi:hypothetical protein